MRTIKLRVWDKELKSMESPCVPYGDGINDAIESYGENIMQFIGLKDKNGKEIYEGDLVKHLNRIYEVIYYIDRFALRNNKSKDCLWFFNYKHGQRNRNEECEIFGNIHENSNLLN